VALLVILAIHRVIHWGWIIGVFFNCLILFAFDTGNSFYHHGYVNRMIVIIALSVVLFLYIMTRIVIFVCSKGWKGVLAICLLFVLLSVWYYGRVHNSCEGWEFGFGEVKINNDIGECRIETPKYCELQARRGLLDFNRFFAKCSNRKMLMDRSAWPEKLRERSGVKRIGYGRPEQYPNSSKCSEDGYMAQVHEDMIDMDDPTVDKKVKESVEVTVDVSRDDAHFIEIDVKRNETRVEELKEIRKQVIEEDKRTGNTDRVDTNVIVLYIDDISRANFHRQLRELDWWLDQLSFGKHEEYEIFEFFRFHTVSRTTLKANNAMFFGYNDVKNIDSTESVYRYYSENGFITGAFFDQCMYYHIE
jgi:hypothetical protein